MTRRVPLMPRSFTQLTWLGLSPATVAALEPYATLLPRRTPVNINTASAQVLLDAEAVAAESWGQLALAFGVSAITGFIAVRWLLGFIAGHSFVPFGWYRIALGVTLLVVLPANA